MKGRSTVSEVVKVDCPECGVRLKVKPKLIGTQQKCPGCSEQITLEAAGSSAPAVEMAETTPQTSGEPSKGPSMAVLSGAGAALVGIGLGVGWLLFGPDGTTSESTPGEVVESGPVVEEENSAAATVVATSANIKRGSETRIAVVPDQTIFPTGSSTGDDAASSNGSTVARTESPAADVQGTSAPGSAANRAPEANEVPQNQPATVSTPPSTVVVSEPGEPNSIGMVLQFLEAGFYERKCGRNHPEYSADFSSHASYGGYGDENPPHDVVITKPFLIGQTEVTVGQFRQFVNSTGYETTAERNGKGIIGLHGEIEPDRRIYNPLGQRPEFTWKSPGFEQSDDHPVTGVSWDDTQAFCKWLSEKDGATYRLPSEAEWEYACRAGTSTYFSFGNDYTNQFQHYANLADRTLEDAHERVASLQWVLPDVRDGAVYTSEVKSYRPNAWGLYDMHGNVWEWCQDVYNDVYYKRFRATREKPWNCAVDPLNLDEHTWEDGEFRSIRGGAWVLAPIQSRTGTRNQFERTDAACYLGFRVVREAPADVLAEANAYRQKQAQAEEVVKAFEGHQLTFENSPDREGSDLALYTHGDAPPSEFVNAIPYMTRIRMFRPHGELSSELVRASSRLPQLRRLVFSYPQDVCPAEEFTALAGLGNLVDFRVEGSQLTPTQLRDFQCLPNLRMLGFGNENTSDEQILMLKGLDFGNLKWLNLQKTTSDGRGLAAFEGAPLETVFLSTLTDAGAVELAKFPLLSFVTISQPKITRVGLIELGKLQHLQRLYLENLSELADADFSSLATMTGLRDLRLNGSGAGDQTAEVISGLLLANLRIGSPALTDDGLKHIGNITTLCNELQIGGDAQITDAGLNHLWGPAKLRSLKIHTTSGITGTGFEMIGDMPRLSTVEVFSEDFTDTGMRFLGYLPGLQNVTIGHYRGGPSGVTDEGLMMLAEAPNLKRVTLTRTQSQVTDEGIERFKRRRPNVDFKVYEFD